MAKRKHALEEQVGTAMKRANVSFAFSNLAGYSAGGLLLLLLYYSFLLIHPYLQALYACLPIRCSRSSS